MRVVEMQHRMTRRHVRIINKDNQMVMRLTSIQKQITTLIIIKKEMKINPDEEETYNLENKSLSELDRLPLARWHIFVMLALGLVWIFDGYEVTLISIYRPQIEINHSQAIFKALVSAYQIGGMVGSLLFGLLAFVVGRRKIFLITLGLYFFGVLFSGIDTHPAIFVLARFITGLSVGGQFTAIFTGVDEFMPPKYRGRVNIGIDGTWHLGGTMASLLTLIVDESNWRAMFLLGWAGIAALIMMRRNVPESPRWLLLKGRSKEASLIINAIVQTVTLNEVLLKEIEAQPEEQPSKSNRSFCSYIIEIVKLLRQGITVHTKKFIVSFTLIFTQALFFNLIYYQYPSILANKYALEQSKISLYMLPLSAISFLSTLFVGPFFDTVGRRQLLLITYSASGVLLLIDYTVDQLFWREIFVCILFVFASPASSSANLIASEIFPTSSRTLMLFVMFMVSMLGGSVGVWFDNHIVASIMMIGAGIIAFIFCPNSENKSLEQIEKM